MTEPFILLDDARPHGASPARLYHAPREVVVARRADEVIPALERIEMLRGQGLHLAGYLAYEAGLALSRMKRSPPPSPWTSSTSPSARVRVGRVAVIARRFVMRGSTLC